MKLHIDFIPGLVEKLERVNTEARHVAVVQRDANIVEQECEHVTAFRMVGEEVPNPPPAAHVSHIQAQRTERKTAAPAHT